MAFLDPTLAQHQAAPVFRNLPLFWLDYEALQEVIRQSIIFDPRPIYELKREFFQDPPRIQSDIYEPNVFGIIQSFLHADITTNTRDELVPNINIRAHYTFDIWEEFVTPPRMSCGDVNRLGRETVQMHHSFLIRHDKIHPLLIGIDTNIDTNLDTTYVLTAMSHGQDYDLNDFGMSRRSYDPCTVEPSAEQRQDLLTDYYYHLTTRIFAFLEAELSWWRSCIARLDKYNTLHIIIPFLRYQIINRTSTFDCHEALLFPNAQRFFLLDKPERVTKRQKKKEINK